MKINKYDLRGATLLRTLSVGTWSSILYIHFLIALRWWRLSVPQTEYHQSPGTYDEPFYPLACQIPAKKKNKNNNFLIFYFEYFP